MSVRKNIVQSDTFDQVVVIDNYDSFVFNLARYFEQLGQPTCVVRNDRVDVAALRGWRPRAIVISPGPGRPADAGVSLDVVRQCYRDVPILGVCLGHQVIAEALEGRVIHAAEPVHGRASALAHAGESVFVGLPSPLCVGRYHSLSVEDDTLPDELVVTARTDDGTIMGIAHRTYDVVGLQFHPESILTDHGYKLLANFLQQSGINVPQRASELDGVNTPRLAASPLSPTRPVTF